MMLCSLFHFRFMLLQCSKLSVIYNHILFLIIYIKINVVLLYNIMRFNTFEKGQNALTFELLPFYHKICSKKMHFLFVPFVLQTIGKSCFTKLNQQIH